MKEMIKEDGAVENEPPHGARDRDEGENAKLRLGGMALRNGLLVHGRNHWAAAIRSPGGEIEVASGRRPRTGALDGVPGLRGVARLGEVLAVLPVVKRALPGARMPFESAGVMTAVAGAATTGAVIRRRGRGRLGAEVTAAAVGFAPALAALRSGDLAAYHGAEHKAIAAYERGEPDAALVAKEHDRCGSHLVAPMLVANLAGLAALRQVVQAPGPLAGGAVTLAATGVAVELFAWSERHAGSPVARMLRRPGHALQRAIGTREPSALQLEVGQAALSEILRIEGATSPTEGGAVPEGAPS
ncbi:MAG TPA: DUF1385 domain-containing protein [Solirubrobacteraceae bacterium]|jgi:uncharacterized protein YqhQ|nr:DUF1385 domain-containing protein [Solirubrobacteraceae bacterium]